VKVSGPTLYTLDWLWTVFTPIVLVIRFPDGGGARAFGSVHGPLKM